MASEQVLRCIIVRTCSGVQMSMHCRINTAYNATAQHSPIAAAQTDEYVDIYPRT